MEDLFSYISQDTLAGRPFLWPWLPDSTCQSLDYKMSRRVQIKATRRLALRGDGGISSPEGLSVNVLKNSTGNQTSINKTSLPF